jgi:hypothetical protein
MRQGITTFLLLILSITAIGAQERSADNTRYLEGAYGSLFDCSMSVGVYPFATNMDRQLDKPGIRDKLIKIDSEAKQIKSMLYLVGGRLGKSKKDVDNELEAEKWTRAAYEMNEKRLAEITTEYEACVKRIDYFNFTMKAIDNELTCVYINLWLYNSTDLVGTWIMKSKTRGSGGAPHIAAP